MRRRVLLLLVVAVSACLGPRPAPTPTPDEPAFAFGPPVVLPKPGIDDYGSEPSILATRDGSIYVVSVLGSVPPFDPQDPQAHVEERRGDALWKSVDRGATWRFLGKPDHPFGGGDADLDEDEDGTLYLPGQWRGAAPPSPVPWPYLAAESMAVNDQGGEGRWEVFPVASGSYATDRQWTTTYGKDQAWLAFNQAQTGLMVTRSRDSGRTWAEPVVVPGTWEPGDGVLVAGGPNGIPGDLLADPRDGRLYLPYAADRHRLFVSEDGGDSWRERTIVRAPEGERGTQLFGTLALDTQGHLYYVWAETEEGRRGTRVMMRTSQDRGETWSESRRVSLAGQTAVFPWIVAGAPGRVAVAYYATLGGYVSDNAPEDARWYPLVAVATDALDDAPSFSYHQLQPDEDPAHLGALCTGGTSCGPGSRDLGDFFEIGLTREGQVVAAWVDDSAQGGAATRPNLFARMTRGSLFD